ncbi:leukocyte immunoglobulin-like receptor subfamily A member 3 [Hoplias malabaricus]|uniref:leukocyte immunoglobulin-like receptor subfamily A member 3 n=1 Tax=Hoplias malabaricus TaxID=27720 RepID=UPI003462D4A1
MNLLQHLHEPDRRINRVSVTVSTPGETEFQCGVRQPSGSHDYFSDTVQVTVRERLTPTVKVQPDQSVFIGERVTLTCDTQSEYYPNYEWYNKGVPLRSSQSKEYVISSVATDGSVYTCKGKGSSDRIYTNTSAPLTLTVSERPKPTVKVQPALRVFIGERVTLTCEIQSTYPWSYEWKKRSVELHGSQRLNQYLISNVDQSNVGDYTCKGTHSDRIYTYTSDSVRLSVSERQKPTVKFYPAQSVFIGERVTLTCDTQSGGYQNYEWYQSNGPHPSSQRKQYVISSVAQAHTGVYTCKGKGSPSRIYTYTSDSIALTVSVKPQPTLTIKGSVLRENSVTLYCTLGQSAGWTFYWFRDTQSPEIRTRSSIYTISSVSDSNGGQYRCRAGRGHPVYYTHYSDAL